MSNDNNNHIDVDKVNNNIFGTPRLQDLTNRNIEPSKHSQSLETLNTYKTPLESFIEDGSKGSSDVDDSNKQQQSGNEEDYTDDISLYSRESKIATSKDDATNDRKVKDNGLRLSHTETNRSVISNHSIISNPNNYFSELELQRTNTQTDLYALDLQRTMSKFSKKSNADKEGIFIQEMDWDGPDDKLNPQNWPATKKWFVTMTAAGICLVVTFGSSLYVSGAFSIMANMNTSQEMVLTGLTLYLLGLAIGPLFGAPLSEIFGRRIVYITSLPVSMLFIMGVGLSQNIGSILVLRFFSGFFASPAMLIAGGTIADIWTPDMIGLAMSTFCLAPFLGPVIGPVIGCFVAEHKDWKWCMWVNLMAAGAILPFVFLADETYKSTIMRKRAKKRGIKIKSAMTGAEFFKFIMTVTLLRPVKMLVVEPIVMVFSIYVAFVFAVLFGFFEAYPVIFRGTYGMDLGVSGLPFIGIGVGLVIGTVVFIIIDRKYFFVKNEDGTIGKKGKNGENFKHTPESRLIVCKIGAVTLPPSLFWLGWTARSSVHWMAPVAAGVPFGFALILIFFAVMIYMTMAYPPLSVASLLLANNLLRYVLASVFPLFTVQMYNRLGNGWASSLFGFIALAMVPVPWAFEKWGPQLRERSQFGFEAMKRDLEEQNSSSSDNEMAQKKELIHKDESIYSSSV